MRGSFSPDFFFRVFRFSSFFSFRGFLFQVFRILRRPTAAGALSAAVTLRNMQVFAGCHLKFANRPIRDDFGAGNASVFYNPLPGMKSAEMNHLWERIFVGRDEISEEESSLEDIFNPQG